MTRFLLSRIGISLILSFSACATVNAEPIALKRVVELALSHGPAAAKADSDAQRAFASYHEARNQFLPQLTVGSGLGDTWGYPLSLEGYAPSIVNINAQSSVLNPALRDFVRAAKSEWQSSALQAKDQREQIIQDTVLSYAELARWETLLSHLSQEYADALKTEEVVNRRIQEGVDSPVARTQARLTTARVYLRLSQAQGAIDVLRSQLAEMTGLAASSVQTMPDSIPTLPEVRQDDDLVARAVQSSSSVQAAQTHAMALDFRARAEHRAQWPTVDFATQYAVLARFNNWLEFFPKQNFQQNNATIGVVIRFPFLNPTQHAHAEAADAAAFRATKDVEIARNQVSEETLKLQRSVEQLAAAKQVAELEYQLAESNADAVQVRMDAGNATIREGEDARAAANARYDALQDANFELERGRISLLRSTGDLDKWLGLSKQP